MYALADVMTRDVFALERGLRLREAATRMAERGIGDPPPPKRRKPRPRHGEIVAALPPLSPFGGKTRGSPRVARWVRAYRPRLVGSSRARRGWRLDATLGVRLRRHTEASARGRRQGFVAGRLALERVDRAEVD